MSTDPEEGFKSVRDNYVVEIRKQNREEIFNLKRKNTKSTA